MKLVRIGPKGAEKPAVATDSGFADLSSVIADITPETLAGLPQLLKGLDLASLPRIEPGRFGSPIARTGHFIAIGLNYADHAAESGMPIPAEPVVFSKAPSCLSGPDDDVVLPQGAEKGDWEVELALVIGREADHVSRADALDHVFGYMVCNDVSERAWQIEGTGQWMKGKSAPTFGPVGPWLVTADEIADPQALDMFLDVNGQRRQTGNTSTMIFAVDEIVSYLSRHMVLMPGDIIATGTPPGVGMGMKPQTYLKDGDTMRLGIEGLGEQSQKVVRRRA
jgi:2-keto-4-pentenoate hydratase/2-oxohepta-3-ene-1,7-dioic acid hydratase in catechol pathway